MSVSDTDLGVVAASPPAQLHSLRWIFQLGWILFLRDFRYRYRLTYLGWVWAIARLPLMALPVIIVGSQFNLGAGQPVPYAVFAMAGLMVWQVFWDAVVMPQWIARRLRSLLPEVRFPPEALVIAGASYAGFNAVLYLIVFIATLLIFQVLPPVTVVAGVMSLVLVMSCGLAIGMVLIPIAFVYLDVRYALPFVSQVLMWTAPILYAKPESGLLRAVNELNPISYLVDVPRGWLVGAPTFGILGFLVSLLAFSAIGALARRFFHRAMGHAVAHLSRP